MTTTSTPPRGWMSLDVIWVGPPHGRAPSALSHEEVAAEVQEVQRRRAALSAEQADLVLALASARPAR